MIDGSHRSSMKSSLVKVVVTGGAGFIGSHLCDALVSRSDVTEVTVLDSLKTGSEKNLQNASRSGRLKFHKIDLSSEQVPVDLLRNAGTVFHLAANPEVRIGKSDTAVDFQNNVVATRNLLEALRSADFNGSLVFASSSTVYGEASVVPTPEDYGPLLPISMYGATKLACESLISAYAMFFGFRAKLIRFANVVGGRSNHGVIFDFVQKLKMNSRKLEVLGDGSQSKSYVYISDSVDGLIASREIGYAVDVFNLGSPDKSNVLEIARMVASQMGIGDVIIETGHGSQEDGRGWPGDVKNMLLDTRKLSKAGWKCKYSSDMAVKAAVRDTLDHVD